MGVNQENKRGWGEIFNHLIPVATLLMLSMQVATVKIETPFSKKRGGWKPRK